MYKMNRRELGEEEEEEGNDELGRSKCMVVLGIAINLLARPSEEMHACMV